MAPGGRPRTEPAPSRAARSAARRRRSRALAATPPPDGGGARVRRASPPRRLVDHMEGAAGGEVPPHDRDRLGRAPERRNVHAEDLVEALVAEVSPLEGDGLEHRPAVATCSSFRRVAIAIILAERSIAVRRPPSSRSQTSVAATPWPQPTSSTRSAAPRRAHRPPRPTSRKRRAIYSRRDAKKARSSSAPSSASSPPATSGRWLSRGSASTSSTLPAAPAFGSGAA